MTECSYFEKERIGDLYATGTAREILNREDAGLSAEERVVKDRLLAFEKHFLTCEVCLSKVREYQDLRTVFRRIGETGSRTPDVRSRPGGPPAWLAIAASLLFVSTVALTVWVVILSQRPKGVAGGPQTVAGIYELKPASPSQRTGDPWQTVVPSHHGSILLAVEVSRTEVASRRYVVRITDEREKELFKDEDAPVDPSGKLYVHVGGDGLVPGAYTLVVQAFGRQEGKPLAKARFPFRVEGEAGRP